MTSAVELGLVLPMMQLFAHTTLNWNHAALLSVILCADHNNHHRLIRGPLKAGCRMKTTELNFQP